MGVQEKHTVFRFEGRHAFLSNFHPSPVQALPLWRGLGLMNFETAPTVEHAYQAAKCADPMQRAAILLAKTAGQAKALGRRAQLRDGWDEDRVSVMRGLLMQKFPKPTGQTYGEMGERLLATGSKLLVEGNEWNDDFWGCIPADSARRAGLPMTLKGVVALIGFNWLGLLLMERRRELGGVGFPCETGGPGMGDHQVYDLDTDAAKLWRTRERPDDGDR